MPLFGFENDCGQWWEGDLEGMGMIVAFCGFGVDSTSIASIAAAVEFGIGVEDFAVGA